MSRTIPPHQVSFIYPPVLSRGEEIEFQIVFQVKGDKEEPPRQMLFTAKQFEDLHTEMGEVIASHKAITNR